MRDLTKIGICLPPQFSRMAFLETGEEHEDQRLLVVYQPPSLEGSLGLSWMLNINLNVDQAETCFRRLVYSSHCFVLLAQKQKR